MAENELKQAIDAIKAGDKKRGGEILAELIKVEPNNEVAWLWLATCYKKVENKRRCLEKALEINPANQNAQQALNRLSSQIDEPTVEDMVSKANPTLVKPQQQASSNVSIYSGQSKKKQKTLSTRTILFSGLGLLIFFVIVIVGVTLIKNMVLSSMSTTSTPISTPTLSEAQLYIEQIQPAMAQLNDWVKGPWADYQIVINKEVSFKGFGSDEKFPVWAWLGIWWETPGSMAFYTGAEGFVNAQLVPVAGQVSTSGFTVLGIFNGITPPASMRTSHEQIVSCLKYQVELTAELHESPLVQPKSLESKDPCDLLSNSVQVITQYINEEKTP